MATLAPVGRINETLVLEEISRLKATWRKTAPDADCDLLVGLFGSERPERRGLFDRVQLAAVVRVCREAKSLSAAGRTLFAASRSAKASTNDADRLKKYLARFGLTFDGIVSR